MSKERAARKPPKTRRSPKAHRRGRPRRAPANHADPEAARKQAILDMIDELERQRPTPGPRPPLT